MNELSLEEKGEAVADVLRELADETIEELAIVLHAYLYEIALRVNQTPRWVVDELFKSVTDDDTWRIDLAPALRVGLGRYGG